MADIADTNVVTIADPVVASIEQADSVTLEGLAQKLDTLGNQMNWLCENMASLFAFVQQMGSQGGGIRGMLKALNSPMMNNLGGKEGA